MKVCAPLRALRHIEHLEVRRNFLFAAAAGGNARQCRLSEALALWQRDAAVLHAIIRSEVLATILKVHRLRRFRNEVLHLFVDQANESAFGVEAPCCKLSVGLEHRVWEW